MSTEFRSVVLASAWLLSVGATACNDHPLKSVELERQQEHESTVAVSVNKDVDILFVIDNSGSMAEEQATLAANFEAFIDVLEQPGIEANYRIGVTTTDVGHRWAGGCQAPENGRLLLGSCLQRPQDFVFDGDDRFDEACAAVCSHPELETLPTTTHRDGQSAPRPWIERRGSQTNLPQGITASEALSCMGPQGINGCGMEAPLEAMYRAIKRMSEDDTDESGFLRPGALLAVVFVTDEVDCSARQSDEFAEVWSSTGLRTFWGPENQTSNQFTSDVCWNAGVRCETDVDGTTQCYAADWNVNHDPADEGDSVLFELSRYIDLLTALEQNKDGAVENNVMVAVIGGVPDGYAEGSEELVYNTNRANNPDFFDRHGVTPGCSEAGIGEAAPPVRLREFAETFEIDRPNLYSVCNDDYTDALRGIADAIADQIRPSCVETCVADTDPVSNGLQPQCTVMESFTRQDGSEEKHAVVPCERQEGQAVVPEGSDVCYRLLTDADQSDNDPGNDMSAVCAEEGWNLELAFLRRDGVEPPAGAAIQATCSASVNREVDCPGL